MRSDLIYKFLDDLRIPREGTSIQITHGNGIAPIRVYRRGHWLDTIFLQDERIAANATGVPRATIAKLSADHRAIWVKTGRGRAEKRALLTDEEIAFYEGLSEEEIRNR